MKLMTKKLEKRFAQVGSQEGISDPLVIAHFFNPDGAGDWYATEYDAKFSTIFGYITVYGDPNYEWGYGPLKDLEAFKGRFNLYVERDRNWTEKKVSEVISEIERF